ncbi:hypothetical protein [Rhodococcus sp. NPDC003348]
MIDPRVVQLGVAESIETVREVAQLITRLRSAAEDLGNREAVGAQLDQAAAALAVAMDALSGAAGSLAEVTQVERAERGVPVGECTAVIDPEGETRWVESPDPLERARTYGCIRVVSGDDGDEVAVVAFDSVARWEPGIYDRVLFDAGWVRVGPWCGQSFCAVEPGPGAFPGSD